MESEQFSPREGGSFFPKCSERRGQVKLGVGREEKKVHLLLPQKINNTQEEGVK